MHVYQNYLLLLLIGYLLLLLSILFFFLVIRKIHSNIRLKKKKTYYDFIYKKVVTYTSSSDTPLERQLLTNRPWKREVIIDILFQLSASLDGIEERKKIITISNKIGYTDEIKQQLMDKRWWVTVDAIRKVGKLKLDSLVPYLRSHFDSLSQDELLSSARALINTQHERIVIDFLIEKENELKDWTIIRIVEMLNKRSAEDLRYILSHIDHVSPFLQGLFIQLLGQKKAYFALEKIELFLQLNNMELRLKALQALANIGITSKGKEIINYLLDDNWILKVNALLVIRNCNLVIAIPNVTPLLSDLNWWVRFRAAETLYSLGDVGMKELNDISRFSKDVYASDMATRILEDKKLGVS